MNLIQAADLHNYKACLLENAMNSPLLKLFTRPSDAWIDIRRAEEDHPQQYLPRLLALALIPCPVPVRRYHHLRLEPGRRGPGALEHGQRCTTGRTAVCHHCGRGHADGVMIRWMSRGFDAQPTLNQCIGFAAYCATPWFFAGVVGLVPIRWLALLALVAASAYATVLLYGGLQTFLRLRKEQAMLFSSCVWGVGLLLLVTILVSMILFWSHGLMPEYVRPASLG